MEDDAVEFVWGSTFSFDCTGTGDRTDLAVAGETFG